MYQKGKELYLVSDEAFELLQLGIRVDTSLRKLSVYAMEQKYPYERYSKILSMLTDAVFVYRQFVDSLFVSAQANLLYSKEDKDISPSFIKGLLSYLRQNGKFHFIRISTSPAREIFALTKSTDVIVRMCVEFGWNDVQQAIILKQKINSEIDIFKKSADECHNEYWRVRRQIESRKRRKKSGV